MSAKATARHNGLIMRHLHKAAMLIGHLNTPTFLHIRPVVPSRLENLAVPAPVR